MLIASLLRSRSELIVRSAQFLGEHVIVLAAALIVFSVLFVALLWRTLERHADDFWDGISKLAKRFNSRVSVQSTVKRYPKISSFLLHRFAPGEYLGLHLTIGVIIISVTTFVFMQIADEVGEQEWLTTFDQGFSNDVHQHSSRVGFWAFEEVTQLGSAPALGILGFIAAVSLLLLRQWTFFAGWISALVGVGILDSGLKEIFQRVRPKLDNPWTTETGWSFPSGHAMGTVVIYGFLAYIFVLVVRRTSQRIAVVAGCVTLAIAVGLSRLYLGVHYFSDVLAGFVAAFSWLAVCVTGCEIARRGRNNPPKVTTVEHPGNDAPKRRIAR